MDLDLDGRNAVVLGASKGIGREIALSLAREGARVTAVARNEELLQSLQTELAAVSTLRHGYLVADIMDRDPATIARRLLDDFGDFDIVVHNVGGSLVSRDPLGPLPDWEHALRFNAGAAIGMNGVLVPPMVSRGYGRVIHVSSISAIMLRGNPLYASAKAFLNAYVTTVGRSLAATGVVMTAVMPGAVAFPGSYWDRYLQTDPERCDDFLRHHQAVARFGTPQEIANAVTFLAGRQASFMQAAIVPVDGANQ